MGCFNLSKAVKVVRTSSSNENSGKRVVSVYPNPAVDKITIVVGTTDVNRVKVTLIDFSGNNLTSKLQRNNENGLSFAVQSMPSGIYVLKINDGDKVIS